jgi:hypothetical protein
MTKKNQDEWIYEVLGKKKDFFSASVSNLTYAEREKIREKMLQYWKEHNDESTEFLVNGAVLCCGRGSYYSTLNSADHGVYTDISETQALANTGDKKFNGFVSCAKWDEEPFLVKHSCRCEIGEWQNVRKNVSINGKYALDTNSYLVCKHGGLISPVTSGQEYTLSTSYNKYPKFLNNDGTVDELIIKKLLLRNIQHMKENEIDALIKLGIYLCVCEDVNIIKKIICCAYISTTADKQIPNVLICQHTLLDNFIYVSGCANTYARFCSLSNKVFIIKPITWSKLTETCDKLKRFIKDNTMFGIEDIVSSATDEMIQRSFLNVKLLDEVIVAGNLYNFQFNEELLFNIELNKDETKHFMGYTLKYDDGELVDLGVNPYVGVATEWGIEVKLQEVYIFVTSGNSVCKSSKDFASEALDSVGAKSSDGAAMVTWGTAIAALILTIPSIAAAPLATPLSIACTVGGLASGILDSARINNELLNNKMIYLESLYNNLNVLKLGKELALYTAITLRKSKALKTVQKLWSDYESLYPNTSKAKARKRGYLTKDTNMRGDKLLLERLGMNYSYTINPFDSHDTEQAIKNFNNNMKHIRVWNEQEKKYKTISESEGLEEFKEIKSLQEMFEYMNKISNKGELYIDELDIIGHDRTARFTKFIYDYGNGEEKVITDYGKIDFGDLFE